MRGSGTIAAVFQELLGLFLPPWFKKKTVFILVQCSGVPGMCLFSPRTLCPCACAAYFVNLSYMLLSRHVINNDLVALGNNQKFFSDSDPKKQLNQPCNFIPYWPQNALPLVVRGLVAPWLWCPHLLLGDCLAQPFAIAWTHMLPWSKPQAH